MNVRWISNFRNAKAKITFKQVAVIGWRYGAVYFGCPVTIKKRWKFENPSENCFLKESAMKTYANKQVILIIN